MIYKIKGFRYEKYTTSIKEAIDKAETIAWKRKKWGMVEALNYKGRKKVQIYICHYYEDEFKESYTEI